ncbi:MAG: phenylalanine--tRNA ligase subunit beta [Puniceicoccales bacterium]|nr:phenylalanine--tRNA ligase subunit beta [Puniceicoccales bacterium]
MKISSVWLRRYVDLGVDDGELCEIFTSIGLEVEGVENVGVARQKGLVVGEILEIVRHPNADKLLLCKVKVDTDDVRQIVCGAKNFKLNDHVPVALPGTILPGGLRIMKSNLRGINSDGMMCSGKELAIGNDHSGLLILGEGTRVGACLHDEIPIDCDTIFDLSLTANRGDCLSHIGIARDVAAKFGIPLKLPRIEAIGVVGTAPRDHFLGEISIETDKCECYSAICVKNISIGESPDWMKRDLSAIGMRSINNAVDIGNWVMVETGQPVHIFDARKIRGNRLVIRQARDGETVISLDCKKRTLGSDVMVICDAERPLVIAGITGSVDAEVDAGTTDILIESAYFAPESIRRSARQLNISTESSNRFARDIDTSNIAHNCQRVANLVTEICGGEVVSKCWQVGSPKRNGVGIDFKPSFIGKLCGFSIPLAEAESILKNLGFTVGKIGVDMWKVMVPAHRPDIACPADIVSECARIYGSDKIPRTAVKGLGIHCRKDSLSNFRQCAGTYLSNCGFFECCNLSLRSKIEAEKFFGENSALSMKNYLTSDQNCYRNSLLFGLMDSMRMNIQNGNFDTKFFEIGRVAVRVDGRFNECLSVCCVMLDAPLERSWRPVEPLDFYDVKATIFPILKNFAKKIPTFEAVADSNVWQPGYAGTCGFLASDRFQATCGLLNTDLTEKFDVKQRVLAAEIVVHLSFLDKKQEKGAYVPFSQFPRVSKDLSLIVGGAEPAATVESNAVKLAKKNLPGGVFVESVSVFDVYAGRGIPDGMKNIGITINYRSNDRTLTDLEIQASFVAMQKEIENLYEIRKQV